VAQLHAVVTLAEDEAEQSALDVPAWCTGKDLSAYAREKAWWATEPSYMYGLREKSPTGIQTLVKHLLYWSTEMVWSY